LTRYATRRAGFFIFAAAALLIAELPPTTWSKSAVFPGVEAVSSVGRKADLNRQGCQVAGCSVRYSLILGTVSKNRSV
jgi:hypothetical protein